MEYVGLQTQIYRNNMRSVLLLVAFPVLVLGLVWLFYFLLFYFGGDNTAGITTGDLVERTHVYFVDSLPYVVIGVAVWFAIAFFFHSVMITRSVGAHSLSRSDDKRIYNLVENLCMSKGMNMPRLQVIETDALNAFASGINDKSYTVTLTRGIIQTLNDDELEGVIAHELCHIRNRDVRLLIVSIIFVGIFSFLTSIFLRMFIFGGGRSRRKQDGRVVLIALAVAFVGYFITILLKFALSRKREFMADAGAAEMTQKPWALASALRKISGHSDMPEVKSAEVAQLYIDNSPKKQSLWDSISGLFASHPPIEKRIAVLEQM